MNISKNQESIKIKGDGNCLISSIIVSLTKNKSLLNFENNKKFNRLNLWLRKEIANYIRNNLFTTFSEERPNYFEAIYLEIKEKEKETKNNLEKDKKILENEKDQDIIKLYESKIKLNKELLLNSEDKNEVEKLKKVIAYLNKLEKNGTWCGSIEVESLCNIIGCKIFVNNQEFKPTDKNVTKVEQDINLEYSNGHYNCYLPANNPQNQQTSFFQEKILTQKNHLSKDRKKEIENIQKLHISKLTNNNNEEERKNILKQIEKNDFELAKSLQLEELFSIEKPIPSEIRRKRKVTQSHEKAKKKKNEKQQEENSPILIPLFI